MTPMTIRPAPVAGRPRRAVAPLLRLVAPLLLTLSAVPDAGAQVYRWVDAEGVIHLSSERPPAGVKAERLDIPGSSRRPSSATSTARSGTATPAPRPVPAAQAADREALLSRLRTRECVIALEALERKTSGAEPTDAIEIRRLKQTAELNCSEDPARRREQEDLAAQLRLANSPACDAARDQLWQMLEPGSSAPRERVRNQQAYVDEHCTSPVR
jgi:hypothetical protein